MLEKQFLLITALFFHSFLKVLHDDDRARAQKEIATHKKEIGTKKECGSGKNIFWWSPIFYGDLQ